MDERAPEVLLVDDDASVLNAFERQVRLMGYPTRTLQDPKVALAAIRGGAGCCMIVDDRYTEVGCTQQNQECHGREEPRAGSIPPCLKQCCGGRRKCDRSDRPQIKQ